MSNRESPKPPPPPPPSFTPSHPSATKRGVSRTNIASRRHQQTNGTFSKDEKNQQQSNLSSRTGSTVTSSLLPCPPCAPTICVPASSQIQPPHRQSSHGQMCPPPSWLPPASFYTPLQSCLPQSKAFIRPPRSETVTRSQRSEYWSPAVQPTSKERYDSALSTEHRSVSRPSTAVSTLQSKLSRPASRERDTTVSLTEHPKVSPPTTEPTERQKVSRRTSRESGTTVSLTEHPKLSPPTTEPTERQTLSRPASRESGKTVSLTEHPRVSPPTTEPTERQKVSRPTSRESGTTVSLTEHPKVSPPTTEPTERLTLSRPASRESGTIASSKEHREVSQFTTAVSTEHPESSESETSSRERSTQASPTEHQKLPRLEEIERHIKQETSETSVYDVDPMTEGTLPLTPTSKISAKYDPAFDVDRMVELPVESDHEEAEEDDLLRDFEKIGPGAPRKPWRQSESEEEIIWRSGVPGAAEHRSSPILPSISPEEKEEVKEEDYYSLPPEAYPPLDFYIREADDNIALGNVPFDSDSPKPLVDTTEIDETTDKPAEEFKRHRSADEEMMDKKDVDGTSAVGETRMLEKSAGQIDVKSTNGDESDAMILPPHSGQLIKNGVKSADERHGEKSVEPSAPSPDEKIQADEKDLSSRDDDNKRRSVEHPTSKSTDGDEKDLPSRIKSTDEEIEVGLVEQLSKSTDKVHSHGPELTDDEIKLADKEKSVEVTQHNGMKVKREPTDDAKMTDTAKGAKLNGFKPTQLADTDDNAKLVDEKPEKDASPGNIEKDSSFDRPETSGRQTGASDRSSVVDGQRSQETGDRSRVSLSIFLGPSVRNFSHFALSPLMALRTLLGPAPNARLSNRERFRGRTSRDHNFHPDESVNTRAKSVKSTFMVTPYQAAALSFGSLIRRANDLRRTSRHTSGRQSRSSSSTDDDF